MDSLQEDEYWSAYDDAYAKEVSNLGNDVDLAEGRVNGRAIPVAGWALKPLVWEEETIINFKRIQRMAGCI